ncbi:MAG: hypothetical protein RL722_1991 [Pseudomonadota bacterium]|jgi:DNA-binding NarL/FixJ family response regulator
MKRQRHRLGQLQRPIRVGLADDHAIVRMGYRRLLELDPVLEVVAEYTDAQQAWQALTRPRDPDRIDLLTLDLSMPGRSGADLLRDLVRTLPELVIVVVTMHDTPALRTQCLREGAAAFVAKTENPEALVEAIRAIRLGSASRPDESLATLIHPHHQLTAREFEVLGHLLQGRSIEAIAAHLAVSEKTVWNYQTLIRQKLEVGSGLELLQYAQRHGLAP